MAVGVGAGGRDSEHVIVSPCVHQIIHGNAHRLPKRLGKLPRPLVTCIGVLRQYFLQDGNQLGGDLGMGEIDGGGAGLLDQDGVGCIGLVGGAPCQQFIENDPKGVDVTQVVDALPLGLLGRHVGGCACDNACGGLAGGI